jgi:ABC-type transporter Mla subunit MlaD
MSGEFLVNLDSLEVDSTKWNDWAGDLAAVSGAIPALDPMAFSILPNAQQVANAYSQAARALKDAADDGVAQFREFATKLTDSAAAYRQAEQLNVDDIATTRENLESAS